MEQMVKESEMIRVNDDWVIKVDDLNYMPCRDLHRKELVKQKDGTVVEQDAYTSPIGYFSSLSGALKAIVDKECRKGMKEAEIGLNEAILTIQRASSELEAMMQSICEGG